MFERCHYRELFAKFFFCIAVVFVLSSVMISPVYADKDSSKPFAPSTIEGVRVLTAEQVVSLLLDNPDIPIIDSRKKAEYLKGHIEGAVNLLDVDMHESDLLAVVPDRTTPILFYCNGVRCLRSTNAINKAHSWGYQNLIWFRGGWKEWSSKRLPAVIE